VKGWMIGIGLSDYLYLIPEEEFDGKKLVSITEVELCETYCMEKKIAKKIITKRNEMQKLQEKEEKRNSTKEVFVPQKAKQSLLKRASMTLLNNLQDKKPKERKSSNSDIMQEVVGRSSSFSQVDDLKTHIQSLEQLTRMSVQQSLEQNPVSRDVCIMLDKLNFVEQWDLNDTLQWLDFVGFPQYKPNFQAANTNGKTLLSMTCADLSNSLKIDNGRDARTLSNHIRLLNVYR